MFNHSHETHCPLLITSTIWLLVSAVIFGATQWKPVMAQTLHTWLKVQQCPSCMQTPGTTSHTYTRMLINHRPKSQTRNTGFTCRHYISAKQSTNSSRRSARHSRTTLICMSLSSLTLYVERARPLTHQARLYSLHLSQSLAQIEWKYACTTRRI